jgi:hypothetical protein
MHLLFRYNKFRRLWTNACIIFFKLNWWEEGIQFLQQDGAMVHTAKNSMGALCNIFGNHIINQSLFVTYSFIWSLAMCLLSTGIFKDDIHKTTHTHTHTHIHTKDNLKKLSYMQYWQFLDKNFTSCQGHLRVVGGGCYELCICKNKFHTECLLTPQHILLPSHAHSIHITTCYILSAFNKKNQQQ